MNPYSEFQNEEIIGEKMPTWKQTVLGISNKKAVRRNRKAIPYDYESMREMLQPYVDVEITVGPSFSTDFVVVYRKGSHHRAFLTDCLDYIRIFGRLTHRMMLHACAEYMQETRENYNPEIYKINNDQQ